jgi:ribosomal protein S18 acetylase RimI-like enzyme
MALWRVRATVDDRPGYLSVLTASLALRSVNILAVQVHTTEAGAVDDFLVDAPDTMTESDLLAAVARGRGREAFVARAEAQGLADQPTRALALAGRLVHDPDSLGEALVSLLDAATVLWHPVATVLLRPADTVLWHSEATASRRPESAGPGFGFDESKMVLSDPAGGCFEVLRAAPAFTPAEFARAQALVEVSGALLRQQLEQTTLLLTDGSELLIRPALADDLDGVRGLHERVSSGSLARRYLGAGPTGPRLQRLLEPVGGRTLLALDDEDRVIAMASVLAEGDLGEVTVLVADGWQRRAIGTALLRRLLAFASRSGFAAVVAHTAADNVAMLRTLRRFPAGRTDRDGALVSVTVPVSEKQSAAKESPATSG